MLAGNSTIEVSKFELRILRNQAEMLKEYQKLAGDQYFQLQRLTKSVTELNMLNAQTAEKSNLTVTKMKEARRELNLVMDLMKDLYTENASLKKQNQLLKEGIQLTKEKSQLLLQEAHLNFNKGNA